MEKDLLPAIEKRIYTIRGQQVFDRDLANLYGVPSKALNQAVKRNAERFPVEFMFQLDPQEFAHWKSQIVTSKGDAMGLRKRSLSLGCSRAPGASNLPSAKIRKAINPTPSSKD